MPRGKFERTKPHVNVGTIGSTAHSKTMLAVALSRLAASPPPPAEQSPINPQPAYSKSIGGEQASGEHVEMLREIRLAYGDAPNHFTADKAALDHAIAALSQRPVVADGMVMVQEHDALILADFATVNGGVMEQLAARRVSALAPQQPEKGETP